MSKFCEKCGAQINDNSVFCNKCGTKIEATTEQNSNEIMSTTIVENSIETTKKSKKLKPLIIILPIIAVILVVVIACFTIIPNLSGSNVIYSKGASENDSMYNITFEELLNQCEITIEESFDYYKEEFQDFNDINKEQAEYVFNDVYAIDDGEQLSKLICDESNWELEDGDYTYTFFYYDTPLLIITVEMDDNNGNNVTGVSYTYGNEEETINIIEEFMVQVTAGIFSETLLDVDNTAVANLLKISYEDDYNRYIYKNSEVHTVSLTGVSLLSITAISDQAIDENVLEETELSEIIHINNDDLK